VVKQQEKCVIGIPGSINEEQWRLQIHGAQNEFASAGQDNTEMHRSEH